MISKKYFVHYFIAVATCLNGIHAQQESSSYGHSVRITADANNLAVQIRFAFSKPITFQRHIDKKQARIDLCFASVPKESVHQDAVNKDLTDVVNRFAHILRNAYIVDDREDLVFRFECAPNKPLMVALRHDKKHRVHLDLFLEKTLKDLSDDQCIIRRVSTPSKSYQSPRIVIDAGHGGTDPGACGYNGLQEKKVVLAVARHVHTSLKQHGYRSLLTRSTDTDLSLGQRVELCKTLKADLFISIHANATNGANPNASGIETYHSFIDTDNFTTEYIGLMIEDESETIKNIKTAIMQKTDRSKQLAHAVHDAIFSSLRTQQHNPINRGIKKSNFYVLTTPSVPSILIETGFVTNKEESKALSDSRYQRHLATGICNGIIQYVKNNSPHPQAASNKIVV